MLKILFICHGNICRSPMAEFYMKDLVGKKGCANEFEIASAAMHNDEIGNPVYPPARDKLLEHGINPAGKKAIKAKKSDYDYYDYIIGMDKYNLNDMMKLFNHDPLEKVHLLLEYCNRPNDSVADPWYTGDFDKTWEDVSKGCDGLYDAIKSCH